MLEFFKKQDHLKNGVAVVGMRKSKTLDPIYLNDLTHSSSKSHEATHNCVTGDTLSLETFPANCDMT